MSMHPILKDNLPEIQRICELNHIRELAVFGSVLDESTFGETSDVDIYVDFDESNISLEEYAAAYFDLIEALELLFQRQIDITTERSLRNPYFKQELEATKVTVYEKIAATHG